MGRWETFGFGCLGVLLLNGVHYLEICRIPRLQRPNDFGERPYWIDFFGRAFIGVVLAWVYWHNGEPLGPILAMNIGVSAPLILKAMAKTAPIGVPENTD
ncbi:MAG: hypothetical protein OXG44_02410 [Gammaproteobacteria bacterium]|nr:hypothetical protein [Gammaproteobacteria bacterium]